MAIAYYFQSDFCRFRCRGNSNKSWGQSVQAASKAPFAGANISKAVKKTIIIQIKLIENERSEEHTSELQSLMRISYAVFCLKKKKITNNDNKRKSTRY